MIFKLVEDVLTGKKTQTRRVKWMNEYAIPADIGFSAVYEQYDNSKSRLKWEVWRNYSIVPKAGSCSVWMNKKGEWRNPVTYTYDMEWDDTLRHDARGWLRELGYRPAKIRLTAIRCERLHDITEQDARAEGVASVEEYKALWESANGKSKATRWEENPKGW